MVHTENAIILMETVERLESLAEHIWTRAGLLSPEDPDPDAEGDETIPIELRIRMRQIAEAIDLAIERWKDEGERLDVLAKELVT